MANYTGTAKELAAELEKLWGADATFTLTVTREHPYDRHYYGKKTKKWILTTTIYKSATMTPEQEESWAADQEALKTAKRRKQYEALKAEFEAAK